MPRIQGRRCPGRSPPSTSASALLTRRPSRAARERAGRRGGRIAVRRPRAPCAPTPLGPEARARWRARLVGAAARDPAGPEAQSTRRSHRGPSARVPLLRGRDPGGRVRRRDGHDLGPRHVRGREVSRGRGDLHPRRRTGPRALRAVRDRRRQLDDPPHGPACRPGARADARRVKPMLAVLSALPRDEERWAFEIKWDGVRAIAYCDGGTASPPEPQPSRHHLPLPGAPRDGAPSSDHARSSSTARWWPSTRRAGRASSDSRAG